MEGGIASISWPSGIAVYLANPRGGRLVRHGSGDAHQGFVNSVQFCSAGNNRRAQSRCIRSEVLPSPPVQGTAGKVDGLTPLLAPRLRLVQIGKRDRVGGSDLLKNILATKAQIIQGCDGIAPANIIGCSR